MGSLMDPVHRSESPCGAVNELPKLSYECYDVTWVNHGIHCLEISSSADGGQKPPSAIGWMPMRGTDTYSIGLLSVLI